MLITSPYVVTPLENQLPTETSYYSVQSHVIVEASPEQIWENIIRVPPIAPHEQRTTLFHLMGIPQPLEAKLLRPGVGGERHGLFSEEMHFVETITHWQPGEAIRFTIAPQHQTPLTLIGSDYFDVTAATYRLEPLADGRTILYLSCDYALTTHFNGYGRFWLDLMIQDFQQYILQIVQGRVEATG